MRPILPFIWFVSATQATAQTTPPVLQRVAWRLADFVVLGDSTYGVQLLASPNLRSEQGRRSVETTALTLDPSVAHHWAAGVAKIVDSVSSLAARDRTVFETVPLATNLGQGRILVAFDGKGSQKQPFAFVVSDAANSWWLPVSNAELQQLLAAIDSIARQSTLDLARGDSQSERIVCQLDEPPELIQPLRLEHPDRGRRLGRDARVLARYVIDSSGVVRPTTMQFLMTDGSDFTREAERALLRAEYRPGRTGGRPVDTVVWQWFVFRVMR